MNRSLIRNLLIAVFCLLLCSCRSGGPLMAPLPGWRVRDILLPPGSALSGSLALDGAGGRLYLGRPGAGGILSVDLSSGKSATITARLPHVGAMCVVPGFHVLAAALPGKHSIAIFETRTGRELDRYQVPLTPEALQPVPGSPLVLVGDRRRNHLVSLNILTGVPGPLLSMKVPFRGLCYDPVTRKVLAALPDQNAVAEIDLKQGVVSARHAVPGKGRPDWIAVSRHPHRAYVLCGRQDRLYVFDLKDFSVVETLRTGSDPDSMAVDRRWRRVYVACRSGMLNIYAPAGGRLKAVAGFFVGPGARRVAVDSKTHRFYVPVLNSKQKPVIREFIPPGKS